MSLINIIDDLENITNYTENLYNSSNDLVTSLVYDSNNELQAYYLNVGDKIGWLKVGDNNYLANPEQNFAALDLDMQLNSYDSGFLNLDIPEGVDVEDYVLQNYHGFDNIIESIQDLSWTSFGVGLAGIGLGAYFIKDGWKKSKTEVIGGAAMMVGGGLSFANSFKLYDTSHLSNWIDFSTSYDGYTLVSTKPAIQTAAKALELAQNSILFMGIAAIGFGVAVAGKFISRKRRGLSGQQKSQFEFKKSKYDEAYKPEVN